jgi:predicted transcriptional regulator
MRLPSDLVDAIDAMADCRDVDRSTMVRSVLDAALQVRQRACAVTHKADERCGQCGLLPAQRGRELERF